MSFKTSPFIMGSIMQAMRISLKDAPLKDAPLKDAPLKDAPLKDAPLKDAPLKDALPPTKQSEEEKRIRISAAESKRERRRVKRLAMIPRAGV